MLSLAAWGLLVVASVACSPAPPTAEQTFDALVVGSPTPLSLADNGFLDNIDQAQQDFAGELDTFWDGYNGFVSEGAAGDSTERERFLDDSEDVISRVDAELERLEIDLFLTESQDLRNTFAPYLGLWRTVHDSLIQVRDGVEDDDAGAQRDGADFYAQQIAAVAQADFDRVAQAVEQLDPDTAREFLEAEGLNPQDFGL